MSPVAIAQTTTTAASREQIAAFVDRGFLVCEGLLGEYEIAELEADLVRLARGEYPCPRLEALPAELSDDEALARILCIHQPHVVSPVIERFTTHPAIAGILAGIVGAHLPAEWWDGSVKCMQSMFFAKGPGKPGQAWHQDEIYIPTRDRSLCGAWIAVDDADEDNGCLWVLPGSHRPGVLYQQRDHHDQRFDTAQESYGFGSDAGEIPVPVPRGSVVFFNGYLLHRSKPNHSRDRYRRALVNHYMTSQSLLPWRCSMDVDGERIPAARADCRAVHQVAGTDPYAAHGRQVDASQVYLRAERR